MGVLDRYFFKYLPDVFTIKDSNIDGNGKGTLERYLDSFQTEVESYVVDIDNFPDLVDPLVTDTKFLSLIAGLFKYPPYPFNYENWYRRVLDSIIAINKYKGTLEGIRRWFAIWGVTVDITITPIVNPKYNETPPHQYNDLNLYYRGGCHYCVFWTIDILDPSGNIPELAAGVYDNNTKFAIQSILDYLIPINLILETYYYNSIERDIDLGTQNIIRVMGADEEKLLAQQDDIPLADQGDQIFSVWT